MSNTVNHPHYNIEKQTPEIQDLIKKQGLMCPCFVGQGACHGVGSDAYGYYVTSIEVHGKKTVYGLVRAASVMHSSWTEGTMDCSMPKNQIPEEYVVQSGWWKSKKTGKRVAPKFYFCSADGTKMNGCKCTYNWNGAYGYQNPSF